MDLSITTANFWDAYYEARPVTIEHWKEIAQYPDIPLKLDLELYGRLEMSGALRTYVARAEHRLVGYTVFVVTPHPHYAGSLQGVQDVIYVQKEYRRMGLGRMLVRYAEDDMRKYGVQVAYQHVKLAHSHHLGPLLESEGWSPIETLYGKRLDW